MPIKQFLYCILCLVLFQGVSNAFDFKLNLCQQMKNVEMFVIDGQANTGDEIFSDMILKHYFQPLIVEQEKYQHCLNLSIRLFLGDVTTEVGQTNKNIEVVYSKGSAYKANGVFLVTNEESYYWRFLLDSLDGYKKSRKIDTLIVFVRYFPPSLINKLYELQHQWHIAVVLVFHHFKYSYVIKDYQFNHEIYERLSQKIVSAYYYDTLRKTLLDIIQRPENDRFEFIRNIPNKKDTSCLVNKTIAIVYKPFDEYFCYEDWFVELMVWLENLLVINNKENNVKIHFFYKWSSVIRTYRSEI